MSEKMLVETVYERKGFRMEPIPQTVEEKAAKKEVLFRKVPVIFPVGVMVGINDVADGVGCIRTGWSRCKLPPTTKPTVLPEDVVNDLTPEGKQKYFAAHAAYNKACKDSDGFDIERGIAECCKHILLGDKRPNGTSTMPHGRGFGRKYQQFKIRCQRYFKDVYGTCEDGKTGKNPHYKMSKKQAVSILAGLFAEAMIRDVQRNAGGSNVSAIPGMTPVTDKTPLPPEIREIQKGLETIMGPLRIVGYGLVPPIPKKV